MNCIVPDKYGVFDDVVLGFSTLDEYLKHNTVFYFGSITGRVCNRIENAEFEVEGKKYVVAKNHGKHHLHGGVKVFHLSKLLFSNSDGSMQRSPKGE